MSTDQRTLSRHIRRGTLAVAAACATLASGLAPGLPAAGAATRPDAGVFKVYTLDLGGSKVTSSTGRTLYLGVQADTSSYSVPAAAGQPPISEATTQVTVSLSTARERPALASHGDDEEHTWIFPPASTQELTATSLETGSTLGRFGSLDLSLETKGGPLTSRTCGSTTARLQDVTVSGSASFASMSTGSKAWGTVSPRSFDFADISTLQSASGTQITGAGCMAPTPKYACFAASGWTAARTSAAAGLSTDFYGIVAGGEETVGGFKEVKIASPAGTLRIDRVQYTGARISVTATGTSASVTFSASGSLVGSGRLASTGPAVTDHEACTGGTDTIRAWEAGYSGSTLTAQEQVFGPITLAASGDAGEIAVQTK